MGEIFKLFGTIGIDNKAADAALTETERKGQQTTNKLTSFFQKASNKAGQFLSGIGKKIDINGISNQFNTLGGKINSALAKGVSAGAKALAVGGAATMAAAGATLVKSMNFAGELEQNLGGSEAVFGEFATNLQTVGVNAFETMGLSQSDFLANANKMGSLYQGAGFSVQESMTMTSESMQRASDVASIMGIDVGSAMEAVSGMAKGNFEMMDNLGVAMNDTTIGNYALSKGIQKSTQQMTTQEKVGLANQMFMEKTAKYAGNYAKENDTLAGSLQTAKSALSNFMAGAGSIDAVIESGMNFAGIAGKSAMELAPKLFAGIMQAVQTLIPQIPSIVGNLAKGLADVIGEMFGEEAKAKFESLVGVMSQAVEGIKSAFDFIVQYKDIFTPIAVGIAAVVGFLSAWNIATKAWTAATKAATAIQLAFNTATKANILSIVILAIIGVVAALTYFFTKTKTGIAIWQSFTTFLSNAWTSIKDKATEIFTAVAEFLTGIWSGIVSGVTAFSAIVVGVWSSIKAKASEIFNGIATVISTIWTAITTAATIAWNVFSAIVGGVILSVINLIKGIFEGFRIYLGLLWDGIKAVAAMVWGVIGSTIMGIVNGFVNFVQTVLNGWVIIISTIFTTLQNVISVIFNAIKTVITTVWNAISTVIMTVVNGIVSFATMVFQGWVNILTTIFNTIRNVASTVWNAIKSTISMVVSAIVSTAVNLFNGLKNTITNIWNGIRSAVSNVVNAVKNTISNVWGSLTNTVSNIFNGVKSSIEGPLNAAKDFVSGVIEKIKGLFNFKLSFPAIKLPQFRIKNGSINPVDWIKNGPPSLEFYAKGGILTQPTIFGMNGPNPMIGGEAGAEAVAPIDTLLGYVKMAVAEVIGPRPDGDIIVYQTINAPEALTPRETARQTKLALQDIAALRKK